MTVEVKIPDSAVDQDSPITVSLMTALRNNPYSLTEIRNRYVVRVDGVKDTSVDSSVVPLNLKTDGTYIDVVSHPHPYKTFVSESLPSPATSDSGDYFSIQLYGAAGNTAAYSADIYRVTYNTSTTSLVFAYNSETNGTPITITENTSILADDTFRDLIYLDTGGSNINRVQVKTDGDDLQFRLTSSGIGIDDNLSQLSLVFSRYGGTA